ncbi:MAG: hypothetical protein AAGI06_06450 [Pseudomonadota bacterium]
MNYLKVCMCALFALGMGMALSSPALSQGQVFGVQPGEAHTQPNAGGELWFTSGFASQSGAGRRLTYGIPETDAVAIIASCGGASAYTLEVFIGAGTRQAGQQVWVDFFFDGQPPQSIRATTFSENSEYAGVRMQVEASNAFWKWFSTTELLTVGVKGQPKKTIKGPTVAAQFFLARCDMAGAQAGQPAQDQMERSKVFKVSCPNGGTFDIQFENSATQSRAILYPGLPQQLILDSIVSGSGSAYRNGPLTIRTKGDLAIVETASGTSNCTIR